MTWSTAGSHLPLPMGYIAAIFAERALTLTCAGQAQLRDALAQRAGLAAERLDGADEAISDSVFFALLEAIAQHHDAGRAIGLRIGATMRCDDYGAFGLAFKSAIDLQGSFERVERYGRVVTNIANFTLTKSPHATWMTVPNATAGRLGEIMTNELALAAATALSREVGGEGLVPREVSFTHPKPEVATDAQAFFHCPVRYAGERNGIKLDARDLQRANRLGDSKISEFFDQHLSAELAQRPDALALEAQVRQLVTRALSQGPPAIESIAAHLGMSRRTLQRRLAAQQHAYADLVTRARRELAASLLRRGTYSLVEVAFLTGYADQSTFTRAFKRWEGVTPTDYRQAPD